MVLAMSVVLLCNGALDRWSPLNFTLKLVKSLFLDSPVLHWWIYYKP